MPTPKKTGPLTAAELLALWKSVTDPSYHRTLVEGGDGKGLEIFSQGFAQLERESLAIDRTTQAMFILPHSSQTSEPAGGGRKATVDLTLNRTKRFDLGLTFRVGEVVFEEETTDYGKAGPVIVRTGRRYVVTTQATFPPGTRGPLTVKCAAARIGFGFNNTPIGNIKRFVQPGVFQNDSATIVPGAAVHRLEVAAKPDVALPEHVGRYLELTGGVNAGKVRRVVGYEQPVPEGPNVHGGVLLLAATAIFEITALVGTFKVGEVVTQAPSGARGVVLFQDAARIIVDRSGGTFVAGQTLTGAESGATAAATVIAQSPDLTAETKTTAWRILDWELDLGLTVTNAAQPTGGRQAMLDELGNERQIPRATGESDDGYRKRVSKPADVVSPNAIRRTVNRILGPLGSSGVLREVGSRLLRGLFYDGDPSNPGADVSFAYDMDAIILLGPVTVAAFVIGETVHQPATGATGTAISANLFQVEVANLRGVFAAGEKIVGRKSGATIDPVAGVSGLGLAQRDRYKVKLDYADFRGFFLVGVPALGLGDFGIAYDVGSNNAYDAAPFLAFFDGYPLTAATIYRSLWQALYSVHAGGVGYDLVQDSSVD